MKEREVNMLLMKEIFKTMASPYLIERLNRLPTVQERIKLISDIMVTINISKDPLSFYSSDEQLYLIYLFQQKGVEMGLCPYFYIFYSKRNKKFHHICKNTKEKERVYCKGKITKCKNI